jgi:hypothetical protein
MEQPQPNNRYRAVEVMVAEEGCSKNTNPADFSIEQ